MTETPEPYPGFDRQMRRWHEARQPSRDVIIQCPIDGQPIMFIYPSQNDLLDKKVNYMRRCVCPLTEEWFVQTVEQVVQHWTAH